MHVQEKQTSESHYMLLRQWPCICSGRGLQNRRANFLAVGGKIKWEQVWQVTYIERVDRLPSL